MNKEDECINDVPFYFGYDVFPECTLNTTYILVKRYQNIININYDEQL